MDQNSEAMGSLLVDKLADAVEDGKSVRNILWMADVDRGGKFKGVWKES